jgi:hypothetical protein
MRTSKGQGNTPDKQIPDAESLGAVVEELIFTPTLLQKRLKAEFWVAYNDNPLVSLDQISLLEANTYVRTRKLNNWWSIPGFRDWFLNRSEYRERLEFLFNLSMDAIEEILLSTDPKVQSARVNAIKIIAELGNKYPRGVNKGEGQYLDSAIASMDKAQLEVFLQKQGVQMRISASKGDETSNIGQTIDVTEQD